MPQMKGWAALDLWFWGDEFQQDNGGSHIPITQDIQHLYLLPAGVAALYAAELWDLSEMVQEVVVGV